MYVCKYVTILRLSWMGTWNLPPLRENIQEGTGPCLTDLSWVEEGIIALSRACPIYHLQELRGWQLLQEYSSP